jgi:hypothetical protein
VPFALWPVFPTSDYYGTTDATQVSPPDLLGSVSGQPPTFMAMDFAKEFRGVRGRFSSNPTTLRGSRSGGGVLQVYPSLPYNRQETLAGFGDMGIGK